MKTPSVLLGTILATSILSSCASNDKVELGGAPAWIAAGAKIDGEPDPVAPDNAVLDFEDEGGPVEFKIFTDKQRYQKSSMSNRHLSPSARHGRELIEPGRDRRINRLFR